MSWLRQLPMIHTAYIRRDEAQTRLEWVADSDYRFFPTMPDELFGYILHPVNLAINNYQTHAGQCRGQWPTNPEITNAMFERYEER